MSLQHIQSSTNPKTVFRRLALKDSDSVHGQHCILQSIVIENQDSIVLVNLVITITSTMMFN